MNYEIRKYKQLSIIWYSVAFATFERSKRQSKCNIYKNRDSKQEQIWFYPVIIIKTTTFTLVVM